MPDSTIKIIRSADSTTVKVVRVANGVSPADLSNYVPGTRTVAGHALTGDVTLAVADVSGAAPLASPALTGTPTAPTPANSDNSTKIATTARVYASQTQIHANAYASVAAALAAAPAGGRVVLSSDLTSSTGVTVPDNVTLATSGLAKLTFTGSSSGAAVILGNLSRIEDALLHLGSLSGVNGVSIPSGKVNARASRVRVIGGTDCIGFNLNAATAPRVEMCDSDGMLYGVLVNTGTTDADVIVGLHANGTAIQTYEGSVYIPNAVRTRVFGVRVVDAAGNGFLVDSAASDTRMSGGLAKGCGTHGGTDYRGLSVGSGTVGLRVSDFDFLDNYEAGAYVASGAKEIYIYDSRARGNNTGLRGGGHGIEHLGTGRVVRVVSSGQLGSAPQEGCGIYLGGGGAWAEDCDVFLNWSAGVRVVDTFGGKVKRSRAWNNSKRGAGLSDGIEICGLSASSCLHTGVEGCQAWDDQGTPTQRYGISYSSTGATGVDYYTCLDNEVWGNVMGDNIIDGTNTHKKIDNNLATMV